MRDQRSRFGGLIMNAGRSALIAALAVTIAACSGGTTPPADTTSLPAQTGTATPAAADPAITEIHPGAGGSPHVRADWMIDGARVSITYGRPYVKGRTIGESLDPMRGVVWRLGADEATTLSSDRPLTIGTTTVPAGEHTLWIL